MYHSAEMLNCILLCLLSLTTYGMGQSDCNTESGNVSQLLMGLEDDSVIELDSGCHLLTSYVPVRDYSNITLRGSGSNDTVLTCLHETGLVFLNISNLQIENIIIENCSISNDDLTSALANVNETIHLFYSADGIQVSVLMAGINNLRMTYVTIRNNSGIGLLAINIMNESSISNVVFGNNAPDECIVSNSRYSNRDEVAGGMFLLYSDYRNKEVDVQPSLSISESLFHDNMYCSLLGGIPLVFTISPAFEDFGFTYGSGAGLGLALSQFNYSVNIMVERTSFERNFGLIGALQIQQFQGSCGSKVLFDDCLFEDNGFMEGILSNFSSYYVGAASMILNIPRDHRIIRETFTHNMFQFKSTQFLNNRAYICAGMYLAGLNSPVAENELIIDDCIFRNNMASLSSAFYAYEYKFNGLEPGTNVIINNIIAENNSNPYPGLTQLKSTIITFSMNISISGNSTFQRNQASPLVAVRSSLNLVGNILFEGNTGISGGAILIYSGSYLVLFNNTRVSFINNKVTGFGGAIHLLNTETDFGQVCALLFNGVDLYCNLFDLGCINIATLNIQIIFDGNMAQLGNDIYGDIINNCSWLLYLQSSYKSLTGYEILRYISDDQNNNFMFKIQYSDRAINTDALYLNVLSSEGSSSDNRIKLFPGQMVLINISAEDRYFHSVPLAITSNTLSGSEPSRSQLGLSGYWFLSGTGQTDLTQLSVYGNQSNVSVFITDVAATASTILYFELEDCPYGLIYDSEECVCSPDLLNARDFDTFRCDAASGNITVPQFFWLGRTPVDNYTLHECVFDYCQNDITTVTFNGEDNIDSQCADNRGGILCGKCLDGYSAVFGSNRCRECKTDARILGLIIGFLVAGIMLVLAIGFLNFTVTEGYLNIVIFYANIVQLSIPILSQYISYDAASVFIFISWINFQPGVDTCLFDGMDALTREGFYLFFPFYIFLLMFIIIYLARHSKKITSLGLQATRGFATLLLLCYSSVERTCFIILSAVTITRNGKSYVGWYVDPNIEYGSGVHGFMVFVAIALLVFYIIPFTIILICPPRLMNKTRCGRRITLKFKPILDAFYNPFQEKYTFWIGFRCAIRVFPLGMAGYLSYPDNVFGITVFVGVFLFLHEVIRPYASERHNKLETFFLVNLLLIALGLFYYPQKREYFNDYSSAVYITLLVLLAYGGILYIGLIHIDILFPKLLPSIKLKLKKSCQCRCCSCCSCCCHEDQFESDEHKRNTIFIDSSEVPPPPPATVGVSELREPLLEYGTAELKVIKKI